MIKIDVRCHLILLTAASVLVMIYSTGNSVDLLVLFGFIYLLICGLHRKAVQFTVLYLILRILLYGLEAGDFGPLVGSLAIILYTFSRIVPPIMMGAPLLAASPGVLLSAGQRMHIPRPVLIMICTLCRFFPVVLQEMKSIREGIRARGILTRWQSALLRPALVYECWAMPLIVRCLKLASELSCSVELRGIESRCRRSSIYPIDFRLVDGVIITGYFLLAIGTYIAEVRG